MSANGGCAVEHQVFEQVSKTRPSGLLVARPNVIPDFNRDYRRVAAIHHHRAKPVGQFDCMDVEMRKLDRCGMRTWREQQQLEEHDEPGKQSYGTALQSASITIFAT